MSVLEAMLAISGLARPVSKTRCSSIWRLSQTTDIPHYKPEFGLKPSNASPSPRDARGSESREFASLGWDLPRYIILFIEFQLGVFNLKKLFMTFSFLLHYSGVQL